MANKDYFDEGGMTALEQVRRNRSEVGDNIKGGDQTAEENQDWEYEEVYGGGESRITEGGMLCTVHGARGIFSPDLLLKNLVKVSLYLVLFRVIYTFLFAYLMGQEWHIRYIWEYIPIIAFKSDAIVFATLNSYAVLAIAVTDFLIFLTILFRKARYIQYPFWAWYLGILMTAIQYATLLWLNKKINFGIREDIWIPLSVLVIIATIIVFIAKNRVYRNAECIDCE